MDAGIDLVTQRASGLLLAEIEAGRDVDLCRVLLERIHKGRMRAELLDEADCDEERAACEVPYGDCIGDFLFHFVDLS